MLEHVAAGFVVHLGLKGELIFQSQSASRRRPGHDLVMQPLHIRQLFPGFFAQDEGDHARPAPHTHVNDRVSVAHHIGARSETCIEHREMPLRLELVALMRVGHFLRREVLEVQRLGEGDGFGAAADAAIAEAPEFDLPANIAGLLEAGAFTKCIQGD